MSPELLAIHFFHSAIAMHCTTEPIFKFFFGEEEENQREGQQALLLYLIFRHLCQTQTNVYAVYNVEGEGGHPSSSSSNQQVETVVQRRIAEAIFPTASLLNHSCKQNTLLNYTGRTLKIRFPFPSPQQTHHKHNTAYFLLILSK